MVSGNGETTTSGLRLDGTVADAIRRHFRDGGARSTGHAAQRFEVSEQTVLEVLADEWPIVPLRDGIFRLLVEALPTLGPVRVVVRNRATDLEVVGAFGGFSESEPYLNVQSGSLEMRILPQEITGIFSVEMASSDVAGAMASFQFFDPSGTAAFKVYVPDGDPATTADRLAAFHALREHFQVRAPAAAPVGAGVGEAASPWPTRTVRPLPTPAEAGTAETETEPEPTDPAAPQPRDPATVATRAKIKSIFEDNPAGARPHRPLPRRLRLVRLVKLIVVIAASLTVGSLIANTFILPLFWQHYENYPRLMGAPKYTETSQNVANDPLNVALLGSEDELIRSLVNAGWSPADPRTFARLTDHIPAGQRNRLSYPREVVESLFLRDKPQDLVFERSIVKGSRRFVRFWEMKELGQSGRPLWLGAVSTDIEGKPNQPGETPPRRITPDIDTAREALIDDLSQTWQDKDPSHRVGLTEVAATTGSGPTFSGHNASGDSYYTDGELAFGRLGPTDRPPIRIASPFLVSVKDRVWSEIGPILGGSGD